jgi:ketosteroid isomerase-like protein
LAGKVDLRVWGQGSCREAFNCIKKEILMTAKQLKSVCFGFLGAGLLVTVSLTSVETRLFAGDTPGKGTGAVAWNAAEGKALERELIKLHEALNAMDLDAVKREVIGDDVLVTFDVDPDTLKPVKLASQDDMLRYTQHFFNSLKKAGATSKAEHPMIACRATANFGACTEECKVKLTLADGSQQEQQLRATVLAVKQGDNWKFIQWHMSEAGPSHPLQP